MKYLFYVTLAASALMFTACTPEKTTPESVAQKHVAAQVVAGEGLKTDTTGLTFTVIETIDNTAIVEVGGTVAVQGQVKAVKNAKGQWEIQ